MKYRVTWKFFYHGYNFIESPLINSPKGVCKYIHYIRTELQALKPKHIIVIKAYESL